VDSNLVPDETDVVVGKVPHLVLLCLLFSLGLVSLNVVLGVGGKGVHGPRGLVKCLVRAWSISCKQQGKTDL
jgi:hypothetical protein